MLSPYDVSSSEGLESASQEVERLLGADVHSLFQVGDRFAGQQTAPELHDDCSTCSSTR